MAALTASINKTGALQLCDQFPHLGRHSIIPILLREAQFSPRSPFGCGQL